MRRRHYLLDLSASRILGMTAALHVVNIGRSIGILAWAVTGLNRNSQKTSCHGSSRLFSSPCLQDPHGRPNPAIVLQNVANYIQSNNNEKNFKGNYDDGEINWDVYGDFDDASKSGSYLRRFEAELAQEFGMEDAVFMPSGVLAQSIALLIHRDHYCQKNEHVINDAGPENIVVEDSNSVPLSSRRFHFICHETSHLLLHEEEGYGELLRLEPIIVSTKDKAVLRKTSSGFENGLRSIPPMAMKDVQEAMERHNKEQNPPLSSSSSSRTGTFSSVVALIVEIPHRELGGKVTPWEDLLQMQEYCQSRGIAFHCDGARIFEATTGFQFKKNDNFQQDNNSTTNRKATATLRKLAGLFDSMYVSCYKGLGGHLSGAFLLGNASFCQSARLWLRRFGGNLYTLLPMAIAARMGYEQEWNLHRTGDDGDVPSPSSSLPPLLSFEEKKRKLTRLVHQLSSEPTITKWLAFDPPVPETNMVHGYLRNCSLEDCTVAFSQAQVRVANDQPAFGEKEETESRKPQDETNSSKTPSSTSVELVRRFRNVDPHQQPWAFERGYKVMFEWAMGQANGRFHDDVFVQGWIKFSQHLDAINSKKAQPPQC